MNIIKSSTERLYNSNPQKHIEFIARTCYKSENNITDESHKTMCKNLYKNKHWAMLEHFIFIYKINKMTNFKSTFVEILNSEKYVDITEQFINDERRTIISFNTRSLLDLLIKYKDHDYILHDLIMLIEKIVYDYDCDEIFGNRFKKADHECFTKINITDISMLTPTEQFIHGWHSIKFICDRGVSHEIVRHRTASFAQESTRYCNYSKDKYKNEITVIKPCFFDNDSQYDDWKNACEKSEGYYFKLLNEGATPQEARSVLPNSLKTELIMTAKLYEWNHFFELRTDKSAHPQIRELAIPLLFALNIKYVGLFNEVYNKITNESN